MAGQGIALAQVALATIRECQNVIRNARNAISEAQAKENLALAKLEALISVEATSERA